MKLLDSHTAYIIHKEALGNEQNSLVVNVEVTENHDLIIQANDRFDKFYPFNSGRGDFVLVLESNDCNDPDFEFLLEPNNGWTDFSIVDGYEYKKFKSHAWYEKLSKNMAENNTIAPIKNKI